MADPGIIRPFRRALAIDPVIIPVSLAGTATAVNKSALQTAGVTSFMMHNPNPFWVWYRGWNGTAGQMPTIKEMGHYIAPGATEVKASQIPQWIAAVPDDEPDFPIYDGQGAFLYAGKRLRLVMLYGSGL